ncbi:MAG: 2-amino-4-hydroxy-6-hydroxymethyldihydropteridine diphosphokinase [Gammaproteobacteria bacterium]|nr:2-amino-4-hydroxy-6-hydroxymethyldihydropteridine diphosphokinase [Gammaproteobacteria bacterium]MDD9807963.1 2-amino-4-hydroxy-6-hydroxymethyldihydropteridine diphosphokinase [Gammaproteobacteria bacterium]MDD9857790.1 2-amino-4-hydroxy-6-hydroxymethyldihydropteridine diphosphokinase [Gammaproteobacteria bacterium]MDD9868673.1 2-amino-4-hydroxy-6-hydroxymethyldihydropteridine diphosphokinase [Gammaproteobacteria bacterium]
MNRVFLSIGSNIDKEKNIASCVAALRRVFSPLTLSSVYQSAAFGFNGGDFYNLAASFETAMPPLAIEKILRRIEKEHGRVRGANRFESRQLDLDQILHGDLVIEDGGLQLPRAEIAEHAFVLGPLAEIGGGVVHPVLKKTCAELWERFDKTRHRLTRVPMALPPDG